jgi:hypothetical protein
MTLRHTYGEKVRTSNEAPAHTSTRSTDERAA